MSWELKGISVKTCSIVHVKELNGLNPRVAHYRISAKEREYPCPEDKTKRDHRMADIFISYSSNDAVKVVRLVEALKSEGGSLWFDDEQILPGNDIVQKMSEGISKCRYYVICLSPSFDKKPPTSWVRKELKMAILKENDEEKQCIIPVRIKKGGSIPQEIGEKAYADLTTAKRWAKNFPKLCKVLGI